MKGIDSWAHSRVYMLKSIGRERACGISKLTSRYSAKTNAANLFLKHDRNPNNA